MSDINLKMEEAMRELERALSRQNFTSPTFAAHAAIWLQACGYDGLKLLLEAIADPTTAFEVKRTVLGIDLQNISCVRIGDALVADVQQNGRVFLRNVRHGLFLLPASVKKNFGIGCPIDPSFALGGERSKNPYVEKLELAATQGVSVNAEEWKLLTGENQ